VSRYRVWFAFLLLSAAWGSSYLFIRVGLRQLTPLSLVALRLFMGALGILLIALVRRQDLHVPRRALALMAGLASINTVIPFLLISWGEVTVPSGLASVLNSTVPIFSVLIAGAVLHDEPVTLPRLSGVALGFVGVVVLLGGDLTHGGIRWSGVTAQGAIVVASLCYAVGAVFVRRFLRDIPSMTIATYVVGFSAIQTVILSLIFSPPPLTSLNGSTVLSVLWLGLLGTAFAYVLSYFVLSQWGASRYTLIAYMLPMTGLTLGVIFLHESLSWRILAGSVLVIGGIVLASIVRRPVQVVAAPPEAEHGPTDAPAPFDARQAGGCLSGE
jgi:drug/metabolite transporter (DMT)-like permease